MDGYISSTLKRQITSPTMQIEGKGENAIEVRKGEDVIEVINIMTKRLFFLHLLPLSLFFIMKSGAMTILHIFYFKYYLAILYKGTVT